MSGLVVGLWCAVLCEEVEGLTRSQGSAPRPASGREITIGGENSTVASPVHLVAMKRHSIACNRRREKKELPDVVRLMETNGLDPSSEEIRRLSAEHGLMDIFYRIPSS